MTVKHNSGNGMTQKSCCWNLWKYCSQVALLWLCALYVVILLGLPFPLSSQYRVHLSVTCCPSSDTTMFTTRQLAVYAIAVSPTVPISLARSANNERASDPEDMPPGTRVWAYLRHSPGDNQTLESQEADVMRRAREKGWIVTRVFRDRGISGKSTRDRDDFDLMIYLARQKPRPADILIISDFSRFARNQDHAQFYRAELRMNGWLILSMKDDIPPGIMGRFYEAMIDWKNEQFINDLRAHTLRGLRYIAECGCLPGGTVSLGYKLHDVKGGVL